MGKVQPGLGPPATAGLSLDAQHHALTQVFFCRWCDWGWGWGAAVLTAPVPRLAAQGSSCVSVDAHETPISTAPSGPHMSAWCSHSGCTVRRHSGFSHGAARLCCPSLQPQSHRNITPARLTVRSPPHTSGGLTCWCYCSICGHRGSGDGPGPASGVAARVALPRLPGRCPLCGQLAGPVCGAAAAPGGHLPRLDPELGLGGLRWGLLSPPAQAVLKGRLKGARPEHVARLAVSREGGLPQWHVPAARATETQV